LSKTKKEKLQELEKIVDRYFDRDFLCFFERQELIDFKKVFQYLSLNLKNIVKFDSIASQLSLSRYKVKQFIKFLEDSFLIWPLPPFYTDKSKEFSAHNKYYFVDN
jgi:predicted AAA+ superfamily ATPase